MRYIMHRMRETSRAFRSITIISCGTVPPGGARTTADARARRGFISIRRLTNRMRRINYYYFNHRRTRPADNRSVCTDNVRTGRAYYTFYDILCEHLRPKWPSAGEGGGWESWRLHVTFRWAIPYNRNKVFGRTLRTREHADEAAPGIHFGGG